MPEYRLEFKPSASRELNRIDRPIAKRIAHSTWALRIDPRPAGCKKLTNSNLWRLRVGDYRVIYRLDDAERLVEIRAIRHRSQAYSR